MNDINKFNGNRWYNENRHIINRACDNLQYWFTPKFDPDFDERRIWFTAHLNSGGKVHFLTAKIEIDDPEFGSIHELPLIYNNPDFVRGRRG